MVSLARKYMFHDRASLAVTVAIVSLAMLLILGMTGLYFGFVRESSLYIDKAGADVWVYSQGSPNFYYAVSFLPSSLQVQISTLPGVQTVSPVLYQGGTMQRGQNSAFVIYIGYDTQSGLGGPWDVIKGSGTPGPHQVVIDNYLASKLGVGVGDTVTINQRNLTVVGIYQGPGGFLAYYVFVPLEDAKLLTNAQDFVNDYLVKVADGSSIASVISSLSHIPGIQAYSTSQWSRVSSDAILANLLPPVEGMLLIGVLVAILVVGLTNYTVTVVRQREYGILKALGVSNNQLYMVVLFQSSATALMSLAVGALLTVILIPVLNDLVQSPYLIVYSPYAIFSIFGLTLATGGLGAVLPANRIARIDPAIAFK